MYEVASPEFQALRDVDPGQAALELKTLLLDTVDPLDDLAGKTVSGGRLNLHEAMKAISTYGQVVVDSGFSIYGEGNGGANKGSLSSASVPDAGTTVVFDVSGFPNSNSGLLILSTAEADLALFGGTVLVDLTQSVMRMPISFTNGQAAVNFPVPRSAVGTVFYVQVGAVDPTESKGVRLSNGLVMTVQ